jgi:hypothetical protein
LNIGLDLDNTVINYSKSIKVLKKKFIKNFAKNSKKEIKSQIISKLSVKKWIEFQSLLYSDGLKYASIDNYCKKYVKQNIQKGNQIFVISHKTKKSYYNKKIHLRDLAIKKLEGSGLVGKEMIKKKNIYFLNTINAKVKKIKSLKIDLFIDDLTKVLFHKNFPKKCKKILITNSKIKRKNLVSFKNWKEIYEHEN